MSFDIMVRQCLSVPINLTSLRSQAIGMIIATLTQSGEITFLLRRMAFNKLSRSMSFHLADLYRMSPLSMNDAFNLLPKVTISNKSPWLLGASS